MEPLTYFDSVEDCSDPQNRTEPLAGPRRARYSKKVIAQ